MTGNMGDEPEAEEEEEQADEEQASPMEEDAEAAEEAAPMPEAFGPVSPTRQAWRPALRMLGHQTVNTHASCPESSSWCARSSWVDTILAARRKHYCASDLSCPVLEYII